MELSDTLYNWLVALQVLSPESGVHRDTLSPEDSEHLASGRSFAFILPPLLATKNPSDELLSQVAALSEGDTPENWDTIAAAFVALGAPLSPHTKQRLLTEKLQTVPSLLTKLLQLQDVAPSAQVKKSGGLIASLDPSQGLGGSSSCLEFVLLSFCKHFELKSPQAAGLLTQRGKYLAYFVAKSSAEKASSVVKWYQDIYAQSQHLFSLILQEQSSGSVLFILDTFKSGFIAKSLEITLWCCKLYAKLAETLADNELLGAGWDWFVAPGGGLEGSLLACYRFGVDAKGPVACVLSEFARNRFRELFTVHLKRALPEAIAYLTVLDEFLPYLCALRSAKEQLVSSGTADYWVDLGLEIAGACKSFDLKLAAVNFVCNLWLCLPSVVESREDLEGLILMMLKRGCRERSPLMKFACLGKLFQLLEVFSEERNSYAPVVYKTLTFSLVENYEDVIVREFLLSNFIVVFRKSQSIPVGIMLEPLVKQLQVSSQLVLNTGDFEIFCAIGEHPRLKVKNAVQVIDLLGKMYVNESEYSQMALLPFTRISQRFSEEETVQEYLVRLIALCLRILSKETAKHREKTLLSELVQSVVRVAAGELNEKIKEELLIANSLFKRHRSPFIPLLELYGQPDTLISEFKAKPGGGLRTEGRTPRKAAQLKWAPKTSSRKTLKKQLSLSRIPREKSVNSHTMPPPLSSEDSEGVVAVLKRYNRVLRLLFKKHFNDPSRSRTLSEHPVVSGFYSIFKEQGAVPSLLTREELSTTVTLIYKKSYMNLQYSDFTMILVHLAVYVFEKHPGGLSPAVALRTLIEHFRNLGTDIATDLYEEPGPGLGNRATARHQTLQQDPNTELLQGHMKVSGQEVLESPKTEAEGIVRGLLNQLLYDALGVRFLLPKVKHRTVYKTKGVAQLPRSYRIDPTLSKPMKAQIGLLSHDFPLSVLAEAGKLLEDLISSLENNSKCVFSEKSFSGKFSLQQNAAKFLEEQERTRRNTRRQLRKQLVEKELKRKRDANSVKLQQREEEALREATEQKSATERKLRLSQSLRGKRREEVNHWKQQKQAQTESKQLAEERASDQQISLRKEQIDSFLKNEKKKINAQFKQEAEKQLKTQQENTYKEQREDKTRLLRQDKVNKTLKKAKEQQLKYTKDLEALFTMLGDPKMAEILQEFDDSLTVLFAHYSGAFKTQQDSLDLALSSKGCHHFVTNFNISPKLMKFEDSHQLFLRFTKRKPPPADISLNRTEFSAILVSIALETRGALEKSLDIQITSDDVAVRALFQWMHLTPVKRETFDLLRAITSLKKDEELKQLLLKEKSLSPPRKRNKVTNKKK